MKPLRILWPLRGRYAFDVVKLLYIVLISSQDDDDYNPCADRWKNMKEDITRKMWGIFDETGIFLALCRHGFSLVIADMVRSGEL